eukprot:TRINITY_DN77247_c0_g1_i1.p1 TRINITY_DN77247_c0_g1~~TRINITY_DN77247_c0_g1_i1.p1  ORF type:complete len:393 (-),score=51.73 TRINITY_DN77247_c0_g1_i1:87-1202(-)
MARWCFLRSLPFPASAAVVAHLVDKHENSPGVKWLPQTCRLVRCEDRRTKPIAVVGDVFVDVMARVQRLPEWDSDTEADYVKVLPGGSALNQARHLHALGYPVRFFGAVGSDSFADLLLRHVAGQGFSTAGIRIFKDLPSSVCLVLAGAADRAFVSCYSTTDAYSTEDLKRSMGKVEECAHLHIGGYFNLRGLMNDDFTEHVRNCRAAGLTVSLNTQFDATDAWTGTRGHLADLLPLVDLLVVNESEAENIANKLFKSGLSDSAELCTAFPRLTVVVTQGANGCTIQRAGCPALRIPTTAATKIVDTTGAGDAFLAGFLCVWLQCPASRDAGNEADMLKAACVMGCRVAKVCIGRDGACVEPVRPQDLGEE